MFRKNGAQERTRTSTPIQALAPEASASTNSATWANRMGCRLGMIKERVNGLWTWADSCTKQRNCRIRQACDRRPFPLSGPQMTCLRWVGAVFDQTERLAEQELSRIATVFGGSGFVGRYIAQRLARSGWRVRVAVRRPNEAHFVRTYGTPGQVEPILANIRDPKSVDAAVKNADAVVNCVGILAESGSQRFNSMHVEGAGNVAASAAGAGASRLVHISAIGAKPDSESEYARSKAAGELAVAAAFEGAVIVRPSVVFGAEDQFFNRFASMARWLPAIPVVGARTLFQPIYVDDVAHAVCIAVEDCSVSGIYELGGPDIMSFRNLMGKMLNSVRRRRFIVELPKFIAGIMAFEFEAAQIMTGGLFVNKMLTRDQIRQLGVDNVVGENERGLSDLGVQPTSMDSVLDSYLYRFRPAGQFTAIHESAKPMHPGDDQG